MAELNTRATLLVKICDASDQAAWREFVELYAPLIHRFVSSRGVRQADIADVVQDTMKAVATGIQRFEYDPDRGSFRGWLLTVAWSKLNTHWRKTLKHPQGTGRSTVRVMIEQHPDPKEEANWELEYRQHMFNWAAQKVRHEFSDKVWQAFWKTAVENEDPTGVAKALEMSTGSVYVAKCRVINRLREKVQSVTNDVDYPAHTA